MLKINFDSIYDTKKLECTLNKMFERGYSLKSICPIFMLFEKKDPRQTYLKYAVKKCSASSLNEFINSLPEGWSKYKTLRDRVLILTTTNASSPEIPDAKPSRNTVSVPAVLKTVWNYAMLLLLVAVFVYFAVISTNFLSTTFFTLFASMFFVRELIDTLFVFNKLKASKFIRGVYKTCSAIIFISLVVFVVMCILMQFDLCSFECF